MIRQRSFNDCMVAAFATVCGLPYERVSGAFGYPCAPQLPAPIPLTMPISVQEVTFPLCMLGFAATPIMTTEIGPAFALPTSEELKDILPGRTAVLFVADSMTFAPHHALAWDGATATDCRSGASADLANLVLYGAMLVEPRLTGGNFTRPENQGSEPVRKGRGDVGIQEREQIPDSQGHDDGEGHDAQQTEGQPLEGCKVFRRPEVVVTAHATKIGDNR